MWLPVKVVAYDMITIRGILHHVECLQIGIITRRVATAGHCSAHDDDGLVLREA